MFGRIRRFLLLLGDMAEALTVLHRRMLRMEKQLMSVNEGQATLTQAVEQLHTTVEDLRGDIAFTIQNLQNRNTELQTALDAASTEAGELRNLLNAEEIDDAAMQESITRLEADLATARQNAAGTEVIGKLQAVTESLRQVDATLEQVPQTPTEPTEPPTDTGGTVIPSEPGEGEEEPGTDVAPEGEPESGPEDELHEPAEPVEPEEGGTP